MDRQRLEGGLKKLTGTVKERTCEPIGHRHPETEKTQKTEDRARSDFGRAMDAVREVVEEE